MKKNVLLYGYGLLLLLLNIAVVHAAPLSFIENKNQWEEPIKYRANIAGGIAFLLQDGFTFNYLSVKDMNRAMLLMKSPDSNQHKALTETIIHGHAYNISFAGCNPHAAIAGEEKQSTYYNYFIGQDSTKWAGHVPSYNKVHYTDIYPGIDLAVYSRAASLEYDFIAAPGADVSNIALVYNGVSPVIAANGDLKIKTSVNEITEQAPYAYQTIDGIKKEVAISYKMLEGGRIGFQFPNGYDKKYQLVIDPVMVFATYSGSTSFFDYAYSATNDQEGNLYLGALSFGAGWPVTMGAYSQTFTGFNTASKVSAVASISKFNASGDALIYATYYGGNTASPLINGYYPGEEGQTFPSNMTVNKQDELIVTGFTTAMDVPTTKGCYSSTYKGGDADMYVIHFNAAGSALVGATYIGGNGMDGYNGNPSGDWNADRGEVMTDRSGNIYICSATYSTDFPTTTTAFQRTNAGGRDACIFKMDAACSQLIFSTYLGGFADDGAFDMKQNSAGDIVLCGNTQSNNFPTTKGVFAPNIYNNYLGTFGGKAIYTDDGFVAVLSSDGSQIRYATFIGIPTQGTDCFKVDLDNDGNIMVCGTVETPDILPLIVNSTYTNTPPGIPGVVFITRFKPDLSGIIASTRIGTPYSGTDDMRVVAFGLDYCGNIYFSGRTTNNYSLPVTANALQKTIGNYWICSLTPDLSTLKYGSSFGGNGFTYYGTSRFDRNGILYQSLTEYQSPNPMYPNLNSFPTTSNSYSPVSRLRDGNSDEVYAFKYDVGDIIRSKIGTVNNIDSFCGAPIAVNFTNKTYNSESFSWNLGDGQTSTDSLPAAHTYAPGTYIVTLYTHNSDSLSCKYNDTESITLHLFASDTSASNNAVAIQCNITDSIVLGDPGSFSSYLWQDGSPDSNKVVRSAGTYWLRATAYCALHNDTFVVQKLNSPVINLGNDTTVCEPKLALQIRAINVTNYLWQDGSSDSSYIVRQTGLYWAIASNHACTDTDSVYVTIAYLPQNLGKDTSVCREAAAQIVLTANTDIGANILWSTGSNESSIYAQDSGAYWVQVQEASCVFSDTLHLKSELCECHFEMPSAFSPNNDGHNDVFRPLIEPACLVKGGTFNVYNRWGQLVFTSTDLQKGWDGTQNGTPLDMDTYMYTIRFEGGTQHKQYEQKGDVTLVR